MHNPPKILIVDDARMNLVLLSRLLITDGYEVVEAKDGEGGYAAALSESPDLILLDVMMPGTDGYEVCRMLKANEAVASIPVIFVTAMSETVDKVKGLEIGAVDYITKPFQSAEVLARVRTQIKLAATNEENLEYHRELLESQRVASISTLAGGIAHNINNLLGTVIGYTDMLYGRLAGDEKAQKYTEKVLDAAQRIADLTNSLHMYSHAGRGDMTKLQIGDLLTKMVHLYTEKDSKHLNIDLQIADGIPEIWADANQLIRAISNIFVNAQEVSKPNSTITIGASTGRLPEKSMCGSADSSAEDYVIVSITDTGPGMEPETVKEIFEPFFTTKETVGAGLGLSAACGIIDKHGGKISVDTEKGAGSTFHVYLPIMGEG